VPQHLRPTMGRDEIVRTLRTRDLALAKRKLHAVLADIQRDIAAAEARRGFPPNRPSTSYSRLRKRAQLGEGHTRVEGSSLAALALANRIAAVPSLCKLSGSISPQCHK